MLLFNSYCCNAMQEPINLDRVNWSCVRTENLKGGILGSLLNLVHCLSSSTASSSASSPALYLFGLSIHKKYC